MEYGTLDLKIIAAKGLKNVNFISKMEVYAVVTISGGDPRAKQKTPTDKEGGTSPTWNFPIKFTVDEFAAQQNHLTLVITLRAERALGDKDVGEIRVPIKEIIGDNKGVQFVRYQVRKPSGKPKGELNFSYQFGEKIEANKVINKSDEPVTAYPAVAPAVAGSSSTSTYPPPTSSEYPPPKSSEYPPPTSSGYPSQQPGYGYPSQQPGYNYPPQQPDYGYPPQQPSYGYPPTQQPGYGYPPTQQPGYGYPPPQQTGYGYPPQQPGYGYPQGQKPPKKNKFGGGGMGLGLLGGALGGLLIGDMISDAGSGGFDDGGGFDF